MKNLLNKAVTAVMMVAPSSIAPENQYAKSFAAVLCLAVSADFEFEPNEFNQACQFIESDSFLRAEGLTLRTVEFFKTYCKSISSVMSQNSTDFPTVQTELISEARNVPVEYKHQLQTLINTLISCCNAKEVAVLQRINL